MNGVEAIEVITGTMRGDELIVSANGMISRELFAVRDAPTNFYMLGSMGLASSICLGLALALPNKTVIALDGDGNLLMNMGSLATVVQMHPRNFIHIVLDNECYDSTGGQPTASRKVALEKVAASCGYTRCKRIRTKRQLRSEMMKVLDEKGPTLLLIKVEESWKQVPRVAYSPETIKTRFMRSIISS